jgi:predicted metalloendopeptidase
VFAFAALALSIVGCASERGPARQRSGIDRSAIDPAVRPQDDFFRHVNGRWLQATELPPDRARIGVFSMLRDRTEQVLRAIVEAAAERPRDADERRIGALYASFMDEDAAERAGLAPLARELRTIDAIGSTADLAAAIARLDVLGARVPIALVVTFDPAEPTRTMASIEQSGLLLPDRDYYLAEGEPRFAAARAACLAYLARLLALAGGGAGAADEARTVFALETRLARGHWSAVADRDPVRTHNKVALDRLAAVGAAVPWPAYLAAHDVAGRVVAVNVRQPSAVAAFAEEAAATPLAVWRAYLRTRLLDAFAPYLAREFVDARFAFVRDALRGTPENEPRGRRGLALVERSTGDALGRLYVERAFPVETKARVGVLVANLLAALHDSIGSAAWMSEPTRREAEAKLAAIQRKIGAPSRWIDYGALELRDDDLVGNVIRARAFARARALAKLGRPVDRDEWQMTPQRVNAYYEAALNEIVFPAAILQPPMFDPGADDAVNYGAIGAIIGHEISHGFDDEGSQYDGSGKLRVWWTDDDRKRFEGKTKLLVEQYSAFTPLAGQHVNGELTLGENIADNAGLAIAYMAYHRSLAGRPAPVIDGMSGDERFFYGYAQAYRSKSRESALLAQIRSNPHAPAEARVNGAVRNHPAFYSTFGVRPGDGMYLPPEQRVSLW